MANPSPNPKDGDEMEGNKAPGSADPEGKIPRTTTTRHLPIASQLPTRLQYVPLHFSDPNVPGPSGIKQCFRTVKTVRRIPTLPTRRPKETDVHIIIPSPVLNPTPPAQVEPVPSTSKQETLEPDKPSKTRRKTSRKESTPTKNHVCRTCEKRFTSPAKLSQHLLSHTGELPFSCTQCDKKFNSKFKLVRHGLIHSESRAFKCNLCDRTFNRKDHLNNHSRIHNPLKKLYVCDRPDCRKQYTSVLSYKKHTALHSAEEGNLICKICNREFDSYEEIMFHLKVHSGSRTTKNETDKKFTCPHCGRKFYTGKDVRRHLVVHTGRRDFVCQYCPQKFGRKDHLVRHVKNAHPEEKWQSSTPGTSISVASTSGLSVKVAEYKSEDILSSNIGSYMDFPIPAAELEQILEGSSGQHAEIKVEPGIVKMETPEHTAYEEGEPIPGTSRDIYPGSSMIYIPSEDIQFEEMQTSGELEGLQQQHMMVHQEILGEEIPQHLIELLGSDEMLQESGQTVLPTFTQAFQVQSPKPPQPPPPK